MEIKKAVHIVSRIPVFGAFLFSKVNRRNIPMAREATYEELQQRVKELEKQARERNRANEAPEKVHHELERRVQEHSPELVTANERLKREIEQRKRAEEALRESEEKYRMVLEACPDPIVAYDVEGAVIYLNPAFTQVFGWAPEELLGKKIDYVPEENWPETQMMIDKVLAGESFSGVKSRRYTRQRKILDVSISVATYLDRNGIPMGSVHTLRDITERKRFEAQLQQAAKMEAIGTLAGGIAHDFNNLLMGIQGNVSLMLMNMDSTHPYYERLKNIEKQIQSGARLTSHILGYARKGRYEVKPLDLNQLMKETSDTFRRTRKEIAIHRELAEDLFAIEADQAQIEQVLFNLFVNAADAMSGGGNLVLNTMNTTHNNMKGKLYDPKPGNYVLLTVTDTGTGMDKKTMERIFDPFFTTKEMGRGTGLGLASAYGIIKGHGGYIDVESKKGHGTTFSIFLPASEKMGRKSVKAADQFIKGTGTVLLVDDEKVILDVGRELLEAMGYRVLIANDGKGAVEVYKKNRDDIDIVLLDMVMPNMGGGEAYDRMKEINPDIKVLLSSGYGIDGEATEILERGCDSFIQKPFSVMDLSQKLRQILDRGRK
jgi:two-component system cell cycle sensor histidine kinase/response regulator CckA